MLDFIKYNMVQIIAYALELAIFFSLLMLFVDALILANVVGKLSAGCFAFFAHKHFTFQSGDTGQTRREALRYFFLLMLNIPISTVILVGLANLLPEAIAKPVADVITVALTFFLTKIFVFCNTDSKVGEKSSEI